MINVISKCHFGYIETVKVGKNTLTFLKSKSKKYDYFSKEFL